MNKEEAMQTLDGLMLSDGGIKRYVDNAVFSMSLCKQPITIEDHLKWEYWLKDNVFTAFNIMASVKSYKGTSRGEEYTYAHLYTERSALLTQIYDEWYSGGKYLKPKSSREQTSAYYIKGAIKAMPKRLMVAQTLPILSLGSWFLGDGNSSWGRLGDPPTILAGFSTHSFTVDEVLHLTAMLNNMSIGTIKPNRQPHKSGSGLVIRLSQGTVDYFMSLVEPHILEIFGDSKGPSYKDLIKYKSPFTRLRQQLGRRENKRD